MWPRGIGQLIYRVPVRDSAECTACFVIICVLSSVRHELVSRQSSRTSVYLYGTPQSALGSANDVAVTSPDITRCHAHGMSQGDRERSR